MADSNSGAFPSALPAMSLETLQEAGSAAGFILAGAKGTWAQSRPASGAGDINGDGLDDIVLGGLRAGDDAYTIFGSAEAFQSPVFLHGYNRPSGLSLSDGSSGDGAGKVVAGIGDINADGIDDLLVVTPDGQHPDDPGPDTAYVVFGSQWSGSATGNLASLNGADGFRLDAVAPNSRIEWADGAGDVNGDGIDDFVIATASADRGDFDTRSEMFLIYGRSDGFAPTLDLQTLDPQHGTRILGAYPGDQPGASVSGAGDVNGDGYDDLVIGVPRIGVSYVLFGQSGGLPATVDLAWFDGAGGFAMTGSETTGMVGWSVDGAGDVNGDGFADIVIGAPDRVGASAGEVYVVFGHQAPFPFRVDLETLATTDGIRIEGTNGGDMFGWSVSGAGDVNGDGCDDLIIGAPGVDPNGFENAGRAYLLFGRPEGFDGGLDLQSLDGSGGIALDGIVGGHQVGCRVDAAGDVNGDGFDDLLIGGISDETFVVFGRDFTVTHSGTDGDDAWIAGTAESDHIQGLAGNDEIFGGAGDDRIDGGVGTDDQADYAGALADFDIGRNADGSIAVADRTGAEGTDTLVGVEAVWFDGDQSWSYLSRLVGEYGSAADDGWIAGTGGGDRLYGLAGNDQLAGHAGDDRIDGGAGDGDQASYAGSFADFTFQRNADGSIAVADTTGAEGTDTLTDVEAVWFEGSQTWSYLYGIVGDYGTEGDDSWIAGTSGDDRLFGRGGNDQFAGDAGNDAIEGGAGTEDQVNYSGRFSDFAFERNADGAVTVADMTGAAGTDTLLGVEAVWFNGDQTWAYLSSIVGDYGTNGNDSWIAGTRAGDRLYGLDGDDHLFGWSGDDMLDGGAGAWDQANYNGAASDFRVARNADGSVTVTDLTGEEGIDTLANIEALWFAGSQSWGLIDDFI